MAMDTGMGKGRGHAQGLTFDQLLMEPRRFVSGVTADSRQVEEGFLFAALPGSKANGANYITDAVARGASVILATPSMPLPEAELGGARVVYDPNPRLALARIASAFYAPMPETVVAVTGTNGKTSIAMFCAQLWAGMGKASATIGTMGTFVGGKAGGDCSAREGLRCLHDGALTTPDPVMLARELSDLTHKQGVDHVALEASSHGLDQYRLDGLTLKAAGFTYLGRDHMDYHGTRENYFTAKASLFGRLLPRGAVAVLNADSPEQTALTALCLSRGQRVLTYGRTGQELRLLKAEPVPEGLTMEAEVFGRHIAITLPLIGAFQAGNVLCALGLVIGAEGVSGSVIERACAALPALRGVHGRMEKVGASRAGGEIYIDYAHTPDALASALKALRGHTHGKLHVVFGCGGNRDRGKRPQMGAVAAELADSVIVTDDNPRNEDPAVIRQEILAACPHALEVGARQKAIQTAIEALQGGDTLLVAGKGHEQGQSVGGVVHPFDDGDVVRQILGRE